MRHLRKGRKFGRVAASRKAFLRGLATSLVVDEKMTTTVARAKEIRPIVERLVTRGRDNTLVTRRYLSRYLLTEAAVLKVLNDLGARYKDRNGGYTRIIKMSTRKGDGAELARIEFI
ncbi:MAG: 50S ribosomal protein L17 [bacterium]